MKTNVRRLAALCALTVVVTLPVQAQIDTEPRKLLQLGVDQSLHDDGPIGAYAFYYWNMPSVPTTNQTLRVVLAPAYLDSELGFNHLLGERTDLGVEVFGGGFVNGYREVDGGDYKRNESFFGYGGGANVSIYHLFNPSATVPLNGILRGGMNYHIFEDSDDTASNFQLPENQPFVTARAGLRWGGLEPVLNPVLALEVSGWYEFEYRPSSGAYGFSGDRELESTVHRFFGRVQFAYTAPKSEHYMVVGVMGGAVLNADRYSAFRVGGVLPYTSEFPLYLPGYFYGELSTQDFGLLYGMYSIPLGEAKRWQLVGIGGTGVMNYVEGTGQPGNWNSGVGGGVRYTSKNQRWKLMSLFSYGINAQRSNGDGGYSLAFAMQYNFGSIDSASDRAFHQLQQSRGLGK